DQPHLPQIPRSWINCQNSPHPSLACDAPRTTCHGNCTLPPRIGLSQSLFRSRRIILLCKMQRSHEGRVYIQARLLSLTERSGQSARNFVKTTKQTKLRRGFMRNRILLIALSVASAPMALSQNVRLTNDQAGGYTSVYTLATGFSYTDPVLDECSIARGRQNEPVVAVNPRNQNVLIGSSNDYCGVYAGSTTTFVAAGPIWLGYYRSENGGASFQSSLVPGYPGDVSPYAALAKIRTASAGDPVIAWDSHGRVFMGAESSDDPAGTKKTFGDEWVARFDNPMGENGPTGFDGKRFLGSTVVAKGSSAPNLL